MARVVLDIPTEKIPGFIQLILFSQKFLLFDWEFFSNELEFE